MLRQAPDGERHHEDRQRDLTGDREAGREEGDRALVGGDDAEDVADDDEAGLTGDR